MKKPIWVYPKSNHPWLQKIWRIVYRRRWKEFNLYFQQQMYEEYMKRMWGE